MSTALLLLSDATANSQTQLREHYRQLRESVEARADRISKSYGLELKQDSLLWYFDGNSAVLFARSEGFGLANWNTLQEWTRAGLLLGAVHTPNYHENQAQLAPFGAYLLEVRYFPEADEGKDRFRYRLTAPGGKTVSSGRAALVSEQLARDRLHATTETEGWETQLKLSWGGTHFSFDFAVGPETSRRDREGAELLQPFLRYRDRVRRALEKAARSSDLPESSGFTMISTDGYDVAALTFPEDPDTSWADLESGKPFALVALRDPGGVIYDYEPHRFPADFEPLMVELVWAPNSEPRPLLTRISRPDDAEPLYWGQAYQRGTRHSERNQLKISGEDNLSFTLTHHWMGEALEVYLTEGARREPIPPPLED